MGKALLILDMLGVALFAVSGALAAGRKRMDLFGVVVIAGVTALGGGTVRDLVMGKGAVFWVTDPSYLGIAAIAALLTFPLVRFVKLPMRMLSVADAFGLAVFTIVGAQKALEMGITPFIAVVLGMTTAVVGGMIRDLLCGEVPLILRREIYATASLCGAVVFVSVYSMAGAYGIAVISSVVVTLAIRLSAIKWHWHLSLPAFGGWDNIPE